MINRIIIILILVTLISSALLAQRWTGRVEVIKNNHGQVVDSVKIFDWPQTIPEYLKDQLEFTLFNETRLHKEVIGMRYASASFNPLSMTALERYYWRGHFAVYKSHTADLDIATLYKYGSCLGHVRFPVSGDGHYLLILAWGGDKELARNEGDGRMIYCIVKDGQVYLHDAKKCN